MQIYIYSIFFISGNVHRRWRGDKKLAWFFGQNFAFSPHLTAEMPFDLFNTSWCYLQIILKSKRSYLTCYLSLILHTLSAKYHQLKNKMPWFDVNYAQKRISLRKLTETKEESLVATLSSWRNQKKLVVFGFKTHFCRPYRTHAFWETKMLKHQIYISVCGCWSYCLEHIFDWVWVFRADLELDVAGCYCLEQIYE